MKDYSIFYLQDLVTRANQNAFARWQLGEILFQMDSAGKEIVIDKNNKIIEVRNKRVSHEFT